MAQLRLPTHVTVVVENLVLDDGEELNVGPNVMPMNAVPLADFKGSKFYETLIAMLPEWQLAYDNELL